MTFRTTDFSKPHLKVNTVPGSSRQFVHTDMWAIVRDGLPRTEFNQAGSDLVKLVNKTEGTRTLSKELVKAHRETGLPVAKVA